VIIMTGNNNNNGVRVDLMRKSTLDDMASTEKIRYIIDRIRSDHVIILESGLSPDEQSELIQITMGEIDQDEFKGIEIESYPRDNSQDNSNNGFLGRMMNRSKDDDDNELTVIGPAEKMETIHKDENEINTIINM